MPDDFIRKSDFNPNPVNVEGKHRALFRMSDFAQHRGLKALSDSLLAVLPLAVISTILYIAIAIADLATKPELINSITSLSGSPENLTTDPSLFLSFQYISPYLIFCALIPVFFAVAFTFELSRKFRSQDALPVSLISGVVTFIALYSPMFLISGEKISIMEFPFTMMEGKPEFLSGGVFIAVLVSLLNYCTYRLFARKGVVTALPINVSDAIQGGFRTVLPGTVSALIVIALVIFFHEPFGQIIYQSSVWMTNGLSSIYSLIIIVILVQLFAFFGIQGASSVYSIFWVLLLSGSIDPPLWGTESKDTGFATLSTVFFFVMIGGTGATLSLNLAMMRAKSEQIRKLGNMTLIPSLMNANDLIIFGLPLAFNRHFIVPFFVVPLLNLGITYAVFTSGLITAPALFVPPYIPAPLGAFLACGGNWTAAFICIVNILTGTAIYSYFLIPYDMKMREFEDIPEKDTYPRRFPQ